MPVMNPERAVLVGIVAGEPSGDSLGAGFISEFRNLYPKARFVGIGGPKMRKAGCTTLHDMRSIGLMGLDELFVRLGGILKIRRSLYRKYDADPPDVFVAVDVPDFNLKLAAKLKRKGIPTVHYVSPTVWAWREYRIRKIHNSVDRMLVLFPFEADYYRKHGIAATFVGHPVADEIRNPDRERARRDLGLDIGSGERVVALLPGSRSTEIRRLGEIMIGAARLLHEADPALQFILPFANAETRKQFFALSGDVSDLPIVFIDERSRQALEACDIAILASGTAALEAALMERLHVVIYRVSSPTWVIFRMLSRVSHYSMPNHLLPKPEIPELIQSRATAGRIAESVRQMMGDRDRAARLEGEFRALRHQLRANASRQAADAVAGMLGEQAC